VIGLLEDGVMYALG